MNNFKRENRYILIKIKDLKYLTKTQVATLDHICHWINSSRVADEKAPINAVVVEDDWPEYEVVWKLIEDRVSSQK